MSPNSILPLTASLFNDPTNSAVHIRHQWFLVVFFVCAAIVLSNVVHYIL